MWPSFALDLGEVVNIEHTAEYHEAYEAEHGVTCPECRDVETPE